MKFKTLLFLLISFITTSVRAQFYEVLEAKKVVQSDGSKIKKGRYINWRSVVTVKEKGFLMLDIESAMHLKLGPGTYDIHQEGKRLNAWYARHLSLTGLLKRKGIITCKFRYKTLVVPGSDRHYEIDRIELNQKGVTTLKSDTVSLKIEWANPDYQYKGSYYVVIRDYYNQGFIDVIETRETSLTLYPGRYGHRHMYYSVMAQNCRASLRYKLEVVSNTTYPSSRYTNFLEPDH
ncbi:MAG: hypothetical protein AAF551_07760 [Bacteroidota bacterium]